LLKEKDRFGMDGVRVLRGALELFGVAFVHSLLLFFEIPRLLAGRHAYTFRGYHMYGLALKNNTSEHKLALVLQVQWIGKIFQAA
jgi:hypothetical protein